MAAAIHQKGTQQGLDFKDSGCKELTLANIQNQANLTKVPQEILDNILSQVFPVNDYFFIDRSTYRMDRTKSSFGDCLALSSVDKILRCNVQKFFSRYGRRSLFIYAAPNKPIWHLPSSFSKHISTLTINMDVKQQKWITDSLRIPMQWQRGALSQLETVTYQWKGISAHISCNYGPVDIRDIAKAAGYCVHDWLWRAPHGFQYNERLVAFTLNGETAGDSTMQEVNKADGERRKKPCVLHKINAVVHYGIARYLNRYIADLENETRFLCLAKPTMRPFNGCPLFYEYFSSADWTGTVLRDDADAPLRVS